MRKLFVILFLLTLVTWSVKNSNAAVIDFTGGTAYLSDGSTVVPDNISTWFGVDYYEENGFKLDFIGDYGIIGDYYVANNDVIHGHWGTGNFGTLTEVRVSKTDGNTFDLNYFILTSNTDLGGGSASGNEQVYINSSNSYSMILPVEDWGFPGTQIYLDSNFDNISWFSFTPSNTVDCFGMDNFYIDEAAPPVVPIPAAVWLFGSGLIGLVGIRRKMIR